MRNPTVFLVILLLPVLCSGEEKPWAFTAMQFTYFTGNYVDLLVSNYALKTGMATEANSIAKYYVGNLTVSIPIVTLINLTSYGLTNWLYRKNKTVAYICLIALNLAKGYAVWVALKMLG